MVDERLFPKAMGLCRRGRHAWLAYAVPDPALRNVLDPGQPINHTHDACYVPRVPSSPASSTRMTSASGRRPHRLRQHAFNCLAVPSDRHSFTAVWRPPFISRTGRGGPLPPERPGHGEGRAALCHGCSRSDTIDGWRDRRADGGIVIDVGPARSSAPGSRCRIRRAS